MIGKVCEVNGVPLPDIILVYQPDKKDSWAFSPNELEIVAEEKQNSNDFMEELKMDKKEESSESLMDMISEMLSNMDLSDAPTEVKIAQQGIKLSNFNRKIAEGIHENKFSKEQLTQINITLCQCIERLEYALKKV